jgi:hypothetical protein
MQSCHFIYQKYLRSYPNKRHLEVGVSLSLEISNEQAPQLISVSLETKAELEAIVLWDHWEMTCQRPSNQFFIERECEMYVFLNPFLCALLLWS